MPITISLSFESPFQSLSFKALQFPLISLDFLESDRHGSVSMHRDNYPRPAFRNQGCFENFENSEKKKDLKNGPKAMIRGKSMHIFSAQFQIFFGRLVHWWYIATVFRWTFRPMCILPSILLILLSNYFWFCSFPGLSSSNNALQMISLLADQG